MLSHRNIFVYLVTKMLLFVIVSNLFCCFLLLLFFFFAENKFIQSIYCVNNYILSLVLRNIKLKCIPGLTHIHFYIYVGHIYIYI